MAGTAKAKFSFNDLLKYLPELLKYGPYIGVAIQLGREVADDLKDDGDGPAKKVADTVVTILDDIGPLVIANNPKYAATFQQLFDNLRKTAEDFGKAA